MLASARATASSKHERGRLSIRNGKRPTIRAASTATGSCFASRKNVNRAVQGQSGTRISHSESISQSETRRFRTEHFPSDASKWTRNRGSPGSIDIVAAQMFQCTTDQNLRGPRFPLCRAELRDGYGPGLGALASFRFQRKTLIIDEKIMCCRIPSCSFDDGEWYFCCAKRRLNQ